jgi:hypothetical protein
VILAACVKADTHANTAEVLGGRFRSKRALGLLRLRPLGAREGSRYGSPDAVTHQIRSWFCDTAERVKGGRSSAKRTLDA